MLDTIVGLLPLAVGLVLFGAAVWVLISKEIGLGYWLFAAFLVGHGLVQVMFLVPTPTDGATTSGVANPFDIAKSWPVTGAGLDVTVVRPIAVTLITVVVLGFGLAALSTVGVLVPTGWWQGLVLGSTAVSIILLAAFLSPGLILGIAIDAVLLWLVLASVWAPGGVNTAPTG